VNDAPTLILDGKANRMIDEMIDAEARHLREHVRSIPFPDLLWNQRLRRPLQNERTRSARRGRDLHRTLRTS